MKLGTVSYEGKIYNLDNIKIEEVKTIMDKMESSKNQLIKSIENIFTSEQYPYLSDSSFILLNQVSLSNELS